MLGLGEQIGDAAHLRLLARRGDHEAAASDGNRGAREHHPRLLAEGRIEGDDGVGILERGLTLSGERGLDDAQRGILEEAAVGGNGVAGLKQRDVAGDELLGRDVGLGAVTDDGGEWRRELPQRGERALSARLLDEAENAIEQQDRQNRERFDDVALPSGDGDGY